MERTAQYISLLKNQEPPTFNYKEKFYDTIFTNTNQIDLMFNKINNYSQLLNLEQELIKISKEPLMTILEIEGNEDEKIHFEGIKQIFNLKLANLFLKIQKKKRIFLSYKVQLEPETPSVFINQENEQLEIQNTKLKEKYDTSLINITKQRLKEIDVLQNIIKATLLEQDERIDQVVKCTKEVKQNFSNSNKLIDNSKERGRKIRRFVTVLLFCMVFVLFYIHFSNRK